MMNKGYVHLYTGNGKGKTTAAFGLALRALCAGKRVYVGQFVKSEQYNEVNVEYFFDQIEVYQFGKGYFADRVPEQGDIDAAQEGLLQAIAALASGDYDVVVLDELCIAIHFALVSVGEVLDALKQKAKKTELVITGRYAPKELIEYADLVTDMREVKHYYSLGIESREGIDC